MDKEPTGPYVYQPRADLAQYQGRLWAVGGLPLGTVCEGFTRDEATRIVNALAVRPAVPSELDRQIEEYKQRVDRGDRISAADLQWLLNEMIFQSDRLTGRE